MKANMDDLPIYRLNGHQFRGLLSDKKSMSFICSANKLRNVVDEIKRRRESENEK